MSPAETFQWIYGKIKREWKLAFVTSVVLGLLIHMPILLSDIPNHDGLDSMYFDQNMITSGRWFLTVACGFSSYFTLPWLIGVFGIILLGCTAAAICELLEVRKDWAVVLCSGLLVAFPALSSTFAYVFTLDGYMLALLLAVLAVLLTKKYKYGFLPGAVCLAFSLGTYQAYLSVAMILSVFAILMVFGAEESGEKKSGALKDKFMTALRYLYMGALGAALYYLLLQILLNLQGKELAGYQGIDGMVSGAATDGLFSVLVNMYKDFVAFTFRGNVLFQNVFSAVACSLLLAVVTVVVILLAIERKWWKNPICFVIIGVAVLLLPMITNIILVISPNVTYHLLMRYQWVLYLIGAVALGSNLNKGKMGNLLQWLTCMATFVLIFCYGVTDNIAYSNLQKKYEKTYAYCIRLLDRIEQTEGYYQGIPIAMIGVVGQEQYPVTDLTSEVTSNMIGMSGDYLLYTGGNYSAFIQHYLGATLNILPAEAMAQMYYSEEYIAMDTFPGENSIQIIDGVMYVKTENSGR